MRPVLVGIAPARAGEEGQPLSGLAPRSTGRAIAEMCGLGWIDYNRSFDRVNVCPEAQPSTINVKKYRAHAENLAGSILRERRVIFLGSNVLGCFGFDPRTVEPCVWYDLPDNAKHRGVAGYRVGHALPFSWAVMPHPSGRNRWYNSPENRELASIFLRKTLTEN